MRRKARDADHAPDGQAKHPLLPVRVARVSRVARAGGRSLLCWLARMTAWIVRICGWRSTFRSHPARTSAGNGIPAQRRADWAFLGIVTCRTDHTATAPRRHAGGPQRQRLPWRTPDSERVLHSHAHTTRGLASTMPPADREARTIRPAGDCCLHRSFALAAGAGLGRRWVASMTLSDGQGQ